MTGTVTQVKGLKQTYCLITDLTGVDYFAHRLDFLNPSQMVVGTEVEFRVKLASTGKRPAATDVVALQKLAA